MPTSLRQTLLRDPDPAWLEKLFRIFGPSWWMQRRPYTFRLAQEYDRMLPSHYVLEPTRERETAEVLDGQCPPAQHRLAVGDVVTLRNLLVAERGVGGQCSLVGQRLAGHPTLRLRWRAQGATVNGQRARVVATRETLLRESVAGFGRFDLPDPLERVPALLETVVTGTQSTIHGDLNLENILVGPGDLVWLIDFAMTRDGHPLADFAHLAAELIAHVLAPRLATPADFVALLHDESEPLLTTLRAIAARCLFNPADPREYH
nr:phosphotransferase [Ardenticatenales bacterium]